MRALLCCFLSFSVNLIRKMSYLELCEKLGVVVNTLTADDKYPVEDWQNLPLSIQTQLFEKRKTFSESFVPFPKSKSNFKHLKKKIIVIATAFPKLRTVKNLVRAISKKCRFSTRFDSLHVKASQILPKSP